MLVALAAGLTLVPAVIVDVRDVRVGDLVQGGDRSRIAVSTAERIVLRLPAGQRQVTLSEATIVRLVRRAGVTVVGTHPVTITIRRSAGVDQGCWATTRMLAAGEPVTAGAVEPAPCSGEAAEIGQVAGMPVVRAAVPAGRALGRLVPVAANHVSQGTTLTLRSAEGPVIIERGVVTMQTGRSGRRVFVRDGEGQIFSAPLKLVEDGR